MLWNNIQIMLLYRIIIQSRIIIRRNIIYKHCIGKASLASEGTLPTKDDLLGCKLEAVHDVAILDLSLRILSIYPQTQLPWPNTQFSLLQASKENAEEHSNQFRFIGCTQANS